MTVNGDQVSNDVEPRMPLVHFIRETLGLKGTHWGRDIHLRRLRRADGRQAGEVVHGARRDVRRARDPHRRVAGAKRHARPGAAGPTSLHALQCGFCTPGMQMTARALLDENRTRRTRRSARLSGSICRCTGYKNIVGAIRWAADREATTRQEA